MTGDLSMRDGWPSYYILVGQMPVAVDMMTWAGALESRWDGKVDRWRVAKTKISGKCSVSTVFLGLDHSFGGGEPVLFETMVFGGPIDQDMRRYQTWDEAERGHAEIVIEARKAVSAIARLARHARGSKGVAAPRQAPEGNGESGMGKMKAIAGMRDLFGEAAGQIRNKPTAVPPPADDLEGCPPDVADLFERIALDLIRGGRKSFSSDAILHRIRWYYHVEQGRGDFKCNDHWTAPLARWFMKRHPEQPGFFETRIRKSLKNEE